MGTTKNSKKMKDVLIEMNKFINEEKKNKILHYSRLFMTIFYLLFPIIWSILSGVLPYAKTCGVGHFSLSDWLLVGGIVSIFINIIWLVISTIFVKDNATIISGGLTFFIFYLIWTFFGTYLLFRSCIAYCWEENMAIFIISIFSVFFCVMMGTHIGWKVFTRRSLREDE